MSVAYLELIVLAVTVFPRPLFVLTGPPHTTFPELSLIRFFSAYHVKVRVKENNGTHFMNYHGIFLEPLSVFTPSLPSRASRLGCYLRTRNEFVMRMLYTDTRTQYLIRVFRFSPCGSVRDGEGPFISSQFYFTCIINDTVTQVAKT